MRYLGGKTNIGRNIADVLKKYAPPHTVNGYIEPFCGALGVTMHMVDDYKTTYISDINKDIIMLWRELKSDTFKFPRTISEKTWNSYKKSKNPSAMRAFVGFGCSFGGLWFSGYISKYYEKGIPELIKSCKRKQIKIKNINRISCKPYTELTYPNKGGYLIYCDPPYKNTLNYKANKNTFDHDLFWDTIRKWSRNNIVIVSEYEAPKDFKCIWEKKKIQGLVQTHDTKNEKFKLEKLFIHSNHVKKSRKKKYAITNETYKNRD